MEKSSYRASFGELFQFSLQTLSKNWLAFLIITAFSAIPGLTALIGGTTGMAASFGTLAATGEFNPIELGNMIGALVTSMAIGLVLSIIITPIVSGANFKVVLDAGQKREVAAMDAIRYGASRWGNLFVTILLTWLLGLVPGLAVIVLIVVASIGAAVNTVLGVLLGITAFVGSVAILILYVVKVTFILPAVVANDIGFGEALKESMSLSLRDDFWDVFLKLLLIGLALMAINMAFSFTIGLIPLLGAILSAILTAALGIFYNNYIMAYYMDRKNLFAVEEVQPELGL